MRQRRLIQMLLKSRRLVVGATIVVVVIAVGALLGRSGRRAARAPTSTVAIPAGDGSLSGTVEDCATDRSAGCRVADVSICTQTCFATRYVTVRRLDGSGAGRRLSLTDGRFSGVLRVGAYTVALVATGANGSTRALATKTVTIAGDAVRQVTFRLSFS